MAYTDLSAAFPYKALFTTQLATDLALNDKLFNDQLTGAVDIPNDLHLGNAKFLRGDVVATGTWRKLIGLDAGNIVQVGDAATEVRLPADPVNVLGAATKQYVDGVQMFETQPKVSGSAGANSTYATIVNLTATTRGRVVAINMQQNTSAAGGFMGVRVTIDGGTPFTIATPGTPGASKYRGVGGSLAFSSTDQTNEGDVSALIGIAFNTSLLIEATTANTISGTCTCNVVYEKIP